MKSLKEIIQDLESLAKSQEECQQVGVNTDIEEMLEYLLFKSIMAEELFTALSELTACDGDYSHFKINDVDSSGLFDLLTDGESYNKAVDVLKKYHLLGEGNRSCDKKEKI